MKRSYTGKNFFFLVMVGFVLSNSCRNKHTHPVDLTKQTTADTAFSSVAMPVNSQILASISTITPESGTKIFSIQVNGRIGYDTRNQTLLSSRISGRIEALHVKYNYQPVKKGQLIMEIYSPELAAAQREFLYIVNTADELMINKARQRLLLLGMSESTIKDIIYEKEVLYRIPVYSNANGYIVEKSSANNMPGNVFPANPSTSNEDMGGMNVNAQPSASAAEKSSSDLNTPILLRQGQYVSAGQTMFTIYQSKGVVAEFAFDPLIASKVQKEQKILMSVTGDSKNLVTATIDLIEPVFRNGQSFTMARVYLDGNKFSVGQLLTANIPLIFNGGWWLPKKSVWQTGSRSVVFKKEGATFKPVEVNVVARVNDMVQIKTDIGDWLIASNAQYLIDSEGFINIQANKTN